MGTRRGTNLPRMGDFNQSVILEAIRQSAAGLSRIELAEAIGLSPQTVTNITRRLLDEGLIAEAGRSSITGPGKPRTVLGLVPQSRYSVGVHLDPAVVTVVLLDLSGTVVARRTAPIAAKDPHRIVDTMVESIRAVIGAAGIETDRIAGVGIAAPGPLDAERGTVIDPPMLPGWTRVPLRELLAEATGLPVVLEKDTTAGAVGELWTRRGPADDSFVFLYLGTGLGAALARDGDVVRGRTRNLGEIGHIVVDSDGPPCVCGMRGCVAVMCTPRVIVDEALRGGVLPQEEKARPPESRFAELCDLARTGDPAAQALLRRAARRTAVLIATLTNMLDVDRVVMGGPFWASVSDFYLAEIPAHIDRLSATRALRSIPVDGTVVGADAGAVGAACVVLDSALTPRASVLLLST